MRLICGRLSKVTTTTEQFGLRSFKDSFLGCLSDLRINRYSGVYVRVSDEVVLKKV
jgi:hypothetical protein